MRTDTEPIPRAPLTLPFVVGIAFGFQRCLVITAFSTLPGWPINILSLL